MQENAQRARSERADRPLRVLVLDDEPSTAHAIRGHLEEHGHTVAVASTAKQAISIGHEFKPQVLVSDWKLGELQDGIDAVRALQTEHRLAVILVTGHALAEMRDNLRGVTLARYFRKPVSLAELAVAVGEASTQT